MSEQHADFLNGLHIVETELERVIGELDEMYDRLGIHVLEVVSMRPLQWALNKLADDLHDADSQLRTARLEVASAQREASEARQQMADLDKTFVQSMRPTVFGGAELSGNSGELPAQTATEPYQWQVGDEVVRNGDVRSVEVVSRGYVKLHGLHSCGAQSDWERARWKLHRKALHRLTPRHVPLEEDLPDIPPMAPQQSEFAAVTEPIDDSVGADGEGQS